VGDVTDLAVVLEQALTGYAQGGPPPSEMVDGLPRAVDQALASARHGRLDAQGLAVVLEAIPRPDPVEPEDPQRWKRVPLVAAGLILIAIGLIALGRILAGDVTVPVIPGPSASAPSSSTAPVTTTTAEPGSPIPVQIVAASTYDPYGEGGENDDSIGLVIDGDPATTWRTERYRDPIELLKPGIGLTVALAGVPRSIELLGLSPGVVFQILWAEARPQELTEWEPVASGRFEGAPLQIQLPPRDGGNWLIWFTSLPGQTDGDYWTTVGEIRFP
jgi:hypothetical protein